MSPSCTISEIISIISPNLKRSLDSERPLDRLFATATTNQCTKFEVSSLSCSRDILGRPNKFKMGQLMWSCPFQRRFVNCRLGFSMINLPIKFEVSTFTHYKDMKGNRKCGNWSGFESLGVTQAHWQHNRLIECTGFLFNFNRNCASILYHFRVISNSLSKVADFDLPQPALGTPIGVTPFKFCQDLWHQKTAIPRLLCGIICVSLCLAIASSQTWWHHY